MIIIQMTQNVGITMLMIEGVGLAELQNECVLAHPIKKEKSQKYREYQPSRKRVKRKFEQIF